MHPLSSILIAWACPYFLPSTLSWQGLQSDTRFFFQFLPPFFRAMMWCLSWAGPKQMKHLWWLRRECRGLRLASKSAPSFFFPPKSLQKHFNAPDICFNMGISFSFKTVWSSFLLFCVYTSRSGFIFQRQRHEDRLLLRFKSHHSDRQSDIWW